MPVSPVRGSERQENKELKIILGYSRQFQASLDDLNLSLSLSLKTMKQNKTNKKPRLWLGSKKGQSEVVEENRAWKMQAG